MVGGLTQDPDSLAVPLLPEESAGAPQAGVAPPQLAANAAVEDAEAGDGQHEVAGGDPEHGGQQAGLQRLRGGLALAAEVSVVLGLLHADQEEEGAGGEQGEGPKDADGGFHPALGDDHLGLEGEADSEVALHGEGGDVEDGAVGAALAQVVREAAQQLPEDPGSGAPEAVEVEGQPHEDEQVRDGHAAQVEVGGGLHVAVAADDQHREDIAGHADHEEPQADGRDGNEHPHGQRQAQPLVAGRPRPRPLGLALAAVPAAAAAPHPAGGRAVPGAAPLLPRGRPAPPAAAPPAQVPRPRPAPRNRPALSEPGRGGGEGRGKRGGGGARTGLTTSSEKEGTFIVHRLLKVLCYIVLCIFYQTIQVRLMEPDVVQP